MLRLSRPASANATPPVTQDASRQSSSQSRSCSPTTQCLAPPPLPALGGCPVRNSSIGSGAGPLPNSGCSSPRGAQDAETGVTEWCVAQADTWWVQKTSPVGSPVAAGEAQVSVNSLFNVLDQDGDGVISQSDFAAAFVPQPPPPRRNAGTTIRTGQPPTHRQLVAPPVIDCLASTGSAVSSTAPCKTHAARSGPPSPKSSSALVVAAACQGTELGRGADFAAEAPSSWFPAPAQAESDVLVDQPAAATRLVDAVVSQEIEGLGECLNICAQRSRTLKLLGFQHLHFDARLQAFLESRARSVGMLLVDILLMFRALLALREVARMSYLWRHTADTQRQIKTAISNARGLGSTVEWKASLARDVMERELSHRATILLLTPFTAWHRVVLAGKHDCIREQLDNMRVEFDDVLEAQRKNLQKQFDSKCKHLKLNSARWCFDEWKALLSQVRDRKLDTQRLMSQLFEASVVTMKNTLQVWLSFVKQRKAEKAAAARMDTKVRIRSAFNRCFAAARFLGADLLFCFNTWQHVMETDRAARKLKEEAMKNIARKLKAYMANCVEIALQAWILAMEKIREEKVRTEQQQKQRAAVVANITRRASLEHNAASMTYFTAWKHFTSSAKKASRQKETDVSFSLRLISAKEEALKVKVCGAWRQCVVITQQAQFASSAKELAESRSFIEQKRLEERNRLMHWCLRLMDRNAMTSTKLFFCAWKVAKREATVQRTNKQSGKLGLYRNIELKSTECVSVCFLRWCTHAADSKALRKAEMMQMRLDDAMKLVEDHKTQMWERDNSDREKSLDMCRKLFATNQKDCAISAWSAWVKYAQSSKLRRDAEERVMHSAVVMAGHVDKQLMSTAFTEWCMSSGLNKQVRRTDELLSTIAELEELAACRSTSQKHAAVSFAQSSVRRAARALLSKCLSGWSWAQDRGAAKRNWKERQLALVWLLISAIDIGRMCHCFAAWLRYVGHTKHKTTQEEVVRYEAHMKRHLEEQKASAAEWVAYIRDQMVAALTRQHDAFMRARLRVVVASWAQVVVDAKHGQTAKGRSMAMMQRRAKRLGLELEGIVFFGWQKQILIDKQEQLRSSLQCSVDDLQVSACAKNRYWRMRHREVFAKTQEKFAQQVKTMCSKAWRTLAANGQVSRLRRKQARALAARFAARGEAALLKLCVADWHKEFVTDKMARASRKKDGTMKVAVLRQARQNVKQLYTLHWRSKLARTVTGWRLASMLSTQAASDTRRLEECKARDRAYIIKLRGKLAETKFWHNWLRVVPVKPYEASRGKRVPDFLKEPPTLYVRPMGRAMNGNNEMALVQWEQTASTAVVNADRDKPAMLADTQQSPTMQDRPRRPGSAGTTRRPEAKVVSAESSPRALSPPGSLTIAPVTMSRESIAAGPTKTLAPGERFVLANQAMTSDADYRRLFEHNRREIRESGGRGGHLGMTCPPNVAWDFGPDAPAPRVTGWGLWMT